MHFPETSCSTFLLRDKDLGDVVRQRPIADFRSWMVRKLGLDPVAAYKVFVVLGVSASGPLDMFLEALQDVYPDSTIIGGMAETAFRVKEPMKAETTRSGLVGLALAGHVPLHAVVSQGVKPISPIFTVTGRVCGGGQKLLMIPYHQVSETGAETPFDTFLNMNGYDFDYLGIRELPANEGEASNEEQPFVIKPFSVVSGWHISKRRWGGLTVLPSFLLLCFVCLHGHIQTEDGDFFVPGRSAIQVVRSQERLQVCLFGLEPETSMEDVRNAMHRLKAEVKRAGQELQGALMFSCNGRGPKRFLGVREESVDLKAFRGEFPRVPISGFYAYGEVGPDPLYRPGLSQRSTRQCFYQSGNVALQVIGGRSCVHVIRLLDWNLTKRVCDLCHSLCVGFHGHVSGLRGTGEKETKEGIVQQGPRGSSCSSCRTACGGVEVRGLVYCEWKQARGWDGTLPSIVFSPFFVLRGIKYLAMKL